MIDGYAMLEQIKAEVAKDRPRSLLDEGWTTVTGYTERARKNPERRPRGPYRRVGKNGVVKP